ncbi:MAG: response regulator [Desulfobacter sp.]|nr:MAG: response regulator [Desulfobacter sp.]
MPDPLTILVIDDEAGILEVMAGIMAGKGIEVHTAVDGEQGLEKLRDHSYHMVITDLKMPGISGTQVLERTRRLKGNGLPVVAMSGTPWLAGDAPFDAVLAKPFVWDTLFGVIRTLVPSFKG